MRWLVPNTAERDVDEVEGKHGTKPVVNRHETSKNNFSWLHLLQIFRFSFGRTKTAAATGLCCVRTFKNEQNAFARSQENKYSCDYSFKNEDRGQRNTGIRSFCCWLPPPSLSAKCIRLAEKRRFLFVTWCASTYRNARQKKKKNETRFWCFVEWVRCEYRWNTDPTSSVINA